jgi:hypothetical protein
MHNKYIIQTATTAEEFFARNKEIEIHKTDMESHQYGARDKFGNYMFIGCDTDGMINSLVINSIFNAFYVLYRLVTDDNAIILPADVYHENYESESIYAPMNTEPHQAPLNKEFTESFRKYIESNMDFLPDGIFLIERCSRGKYPRMTKSS